MTTASESAGVEALLVSRCPACGQKTQLHTESVRRGAEIPCSECSQPSCELRQLIRSRCQRLMRRSFSSSPTEEGRIPPSDVSLTWI